MKLYLLSIMAWASLFLSACSKTDVMDVKELEMFINEHLSPGDSSEKIESFLKEQGWPYAYRRFLKRYQTGYPEGDEENLFTIKAVSILIYVDESKAFLRAEIEEVYTGL